MVSREGWGLVHNSAVSPFLLTITRSGRLAEIRWSVYISKSQRILCVVSFSRTESGLWIYHLLVWSNLNFLHNSQGDHLPHPSCLCFYSFYASLLHSLIFLLLLLIVISTFSTLDRFSFVDILDTCRVLAKTHVIQFITCSCLTAYSLCEQLALATSTPPHTLTTDVFSFGYWETKSLKINKLGYNRQYLHIPLTYLTIQTLHLQSRQLRLHFKNGNHCVIRYKHIFTWQNCLNWKTTHLLRI